MMQKVRFQHPIWEEQFIELDIDPSMNFKQITELLIREKFIRPKRGAYQYIINDRVTSLPEPLASYIPDPAPERLDVRVHGLLVILT